jgi:hypothetical protein
MVSYVERMAGSLILRIDAAVLVLSWCHGGAFGRGATAAVGESVGTKDVSCGSLYGCVVLTASDATQSEFVGDKSKPTWAEPSADLTASRPACDSPYGNRR